MTCALLTLLPSLSGCIATAAAVAQAAAQVGTLYLTTKTEPVRVVTAECTGKIEPIYPDDGYAERLTPNEQRQIATQSVKLREICPEE